MWPSCSEKRVAANPHNGIQDVDLRPYSRKKPPAGMGPTKGSAPGSLASFAWDLRGGDTIYVADSDKGKILWVMPQQQLEHWLYRFDAHSPVAWGGHYDSR
jgi:hypothetical protein